MIRCTKHILDNSNKNKLNLLDKILIDYNESLQICCDLIIKGELPLKRLLSSKNIPKLGNIEHSAWKSIIYKNASEIVRSQFQKLKKERFKRYQIIYSLCKSKGIHTNFTDKHYSELNIKTKLKHINIDNVTINLNELLFDIQKSNSSFDEFIRISSPYFHENKKRSIKINVPINHHKHSLKYNNWTRSNTIQLKEINNHKYIVLLYNKEDTEINTNNKQQLGIDIGYNKLIATSNGDILGNDIVPIYNKIAKRKRTHPKTGQPSKGYKRALIHRTNKINETCNKLNLVNINTLYVEDLKDLKKNTKVTKKFENKRQYWSYRQVLDNLENKCKQHGISLVKVLPSYTSQTCSSCGHIDSKSRNRELFKCTACTYEIDADVNAAINVYNRGVYRPSSEKG